MCSIQCFCSFFHNWYPWDFCLFHMLVSGWHWWTATVDSLVGQGCLLSLYHVSLSWTCSLGAELLLFSVLCLVLITHVSRLCVSPVSWPYSGACVSNPTVDCWVPSSREDCLLSFVCLLSASKMPWRWITRHISFLLSLSLGQSGEHTGREREKSYQRREIREPLKRVNRGIGLGVRNWGRKEVERTGYSKSWRWWECGVMGPCRFPKIYETGSWLLVGTRARWKWRD